MSHIITDDDKGFSGAIINLCTHTAVNRVNCAGSSDTDVVFCEVDLNHNVAAIHCFLFIFEAFCLLALNKHMCCYFTTNSLTGPLFTLDYGFGIAFNIVPRFEKCMQIGNSI